MDFEWGDTERMLIDAGRRAADRAIEPVLAAYPADQPLPKPAMLDVYKVLADLGVLGARIPAADGGSGLTHLRLGIFFETLPPVVTMSMLGHEATVKRIDMLGTAQQKARFLPDLIAGRRIAGMAASEPNVGSDPRGIETRARLDGDHYVLNGTKLWTSNGSILDLAIIVATLGRDGDGRNLITSFLVDRDESPFESHEVPMTGLQQGHLAELVLRDCRVPKANILGEPGHAHAALTFTWLGNRANVGLVAGHLARRGLEASVAYAKDRQQFGKPIGSFQLVQQMLAEMVTIVDASRLLCYRALALLDRGLWCHLESSMAKAFATEGALRVTHMAIQLHGSYGLTKALPLERWARDARMLTMPDGTTQIHQLIIGRELLGVRAFS